jgi:proton-coupled amino acid transporter
MKKRDKAPVLADQQTDKRLPEQQTDKIVADQPADKRLPEQQTAQRLPDQQTDKRLPDQQTDKRLPDKQTKRLPVQKTDKRLPDGPTSDTDVTPKKKFLRSKPLEIKRGLSSSPKSHLDDDAFSEKFGSYSHSLVGGSITRDIYKWKEDKEPLKRNHSDTDLSQFADSVSATGEPARVTASNLLAPGAFRRQFMINRAQRAGMPMPNIITRDFIDFLVLYGYFGGDIYPSDSEDDEEPLDEVAPLLPEQTPHVKGTSNSKAFFMLTKAFVGTGVLFLPSGFANGGVLFSSCLLVALGSLTLHCMLLLANVSAKMENKSFGDIGFALFGEPCRQLVLYSIAVSQLGFCCAYYIFIAQNLTDLLMIATNCQVILPFWAFLVLQLFIYIPLAWVRKLKHFGFTALVGDLFIILGLAYIFFYGIVQISHSGIQIVPLINLESFSLFIGTAMFAFEGICLMLPISVLLFNSSNPWNIPKNLAKYLLHA